MASEYGWGKNQIFEEIYPDELFCLSNLIRKRKMSDYRIALAIAQNPFSKNPKELYKQFDVEDVDDRPVELDIDSIERFKGVLSRGSKFGIK